VSPSRRRAAPDPHLETISMPMRTPLLLAAFLALGCAPSTRRSDTPIPAGDRAPASAAGAGNRRGDSVAQYDIRLAPDPAAIRAIVREGTSRSHAAADLQYLTDVIGPRLTGSAAMRRANDWSAERFRAYGADSVWLEPWTFGASWERGPATLTLLAPHRRQLVTYSWAWAPGTNGPVAGDVAYVDARTVAEFGRRFAGRLAGKWVMISAPQPVLNPDGAPLSAADSARFDATRRAFFAQPTDSAERAFRQVRLSLLAGERIAGLIRDGAKEFGLLTMSGSPDSPYPFPHLVIAHEEYAQFHRLLAAGERVSVEADVRNTFSADPVQAYNTVAEIRGAGKPDEIVLLGAHLDSWDLATGATDNATGSIAVLEAARILKAAGVRPTRTIRFALFSGEEQGLIGSQRYAAAHAGELDRYQAVLVLDNGTGRITGMSLQGRDDLRDAWQSLLNAAGELGPFEVKSRTKGGTDHLPFLRYGVPAFNYDQLSRGYDHTHHSQVDDFDHALPADVAQAATVMAATAFQLANLPTLLPRKPVGQQAP
jgi:carboxypeptidase Q